MARTKTNVSTTSAADEEKISVEVEETTTNTNETSLEETKEETKDEPVEEEKTSKKQKKFGDDDDVKIMCPSLAGKTAIGKASVITFDEKGIATVKGFEATRLLTIPGYTLA